MGVPENVMIDETSSTTSCVVTLLMPCLNEAETLETCITKAKNGLDAAGVPGEILIADNGSSDGSQEIAVRNGARVVNVPRRGYGAALAAGIQAAQGKYVIMGDADDSYDWSSIKPFVDKLQEGYPMVMGTRLRGKILPGAMPPLHRWLGNPMLTAIGNILFRTHISDYHCGMRGFERSTILSFNLMTPGMEFATELVAKAALHRLKMAEVPITYYPDGRTRAPHLRTWRDGWRHLIFMLLMSPGWVFYGPGLLFVLCGLLGNLLIMPGTFFVGPVGFDVHTLVVANTSVVIGTLVLIMGVIAKTFSAYSGMLPSTRASRFASRSGILSVGLLIGVTLAVIGLVPVVHSVQLWADVRFGSLNERDVLRWLVPGLTLITVGVQVFFGSFVLGLLNFYKMWGSSK
jgi:glycosyltransferase involved in cell wall biosynthesis